VVSAAGAMTSHAGTKVCKSKMKDASDDVLMVSAAGAKQFTRSRELFF